MILAMMLAPTIRVNAYTYTDKADYQPGELVTIFGDNSNGDLYAIGVPVTVDVTGPSDDHYFCTSPAVSDDGTWYCQITLPTELAKAVGDYTYITWQVEGVTIETGTFTDAIKKDFKQCANNDSAGYGNCWWIGSILQHSNSIYYEGMGVPQRAILSGITTTTDDAHWLEFQHQATKGGSNNSHAYDWLVSYDQAEVLAAEAGMPYVDLWGEVCGSTIQGFASDICTAIQPGGLEDHCVLVDVPDDAYQSTVYTFGGSGYQPRINAFESTYGNRTITLCGNAEITSYSLVLKPQDGLTLPGHTQADDGTADDYLQYRLSWTSTSTDIMVLFAGHLALSTDDSIGWGMPEGSSNINGGPYHFSLEKLDGASLGAVDNQIMGADIMIRYEPSVTILKTGDELSKRGDDVTYHILVTNTSTASTPDLVCTVTDPTIGFSQSVTLASGAFNNWDVPWTIPMDAGDPYDNTATVSCAYASAPLTEQASANSTWSTNLFQPSVDVTKTGSLVSKVGDPVNYTITVTNTSSADSPNLVNGTIVDTLLGNLLDAANSYVTSSDCTATLATGASCTILATRTVLGTDPDPLPNTVTVHYNPVGFPNDITDSDSHSVDLFQPAINLLKTGDALSKAGDGVSYTITLQNLSSADTPDMVCTISDATIGYSELVTLASGASDVNIIPFTIPEAFVGDDFPNTASVTCSPTGFPNVYTDEASWSIELFQPAINLIKTGTELSKAGDGVSFTITLENLSSADTPDLVCAISDATIGLTKNVTLASGANTSMWCRSPSRRTLRVTTS
jgi:uncharacterized repeat protein (TIGR01451 family)